MSEEMLENTHETTEAQEMYVAGQMDPDEEIQ